MPASDGALLAIMLRAASRRGVLRDLPATAAACRGDFGMYAVLASLNPQCALSRQ